MEWIGTVGLFAVIYGVGELLVNTVLFPMLNQRYMRGRVMKGSKARLKGLLERFVLFLGLVAGVEQIVTLFSALKLGTYFLGKEPDYEKVSKDYFLIGNLVSIGLAISYMLWWKQLGGWVWMDVIVGWLSCGC